jgi:hypothetical protein
VELKWAKETNYYHFWGCNLKGSMQYGRTIAAHVFRNLHCLHGLEF